MQESDGQMADNGLGQGPTKFLGRFDVATIQTHWSFPRPNQGLGPVRCIPREEPSPPRSRGRLFPRGGPSGHLRRHIHQEPPHPTPTVPTSRTLIFAMRSLTSIRKTQAHPNPFGQQRGEIQGMTGLIGPSLQQGTGALT